MTPPRSDSTAAQRLGGGALALERPRFGARDLVRPRFGLGALVALCLMVAAATLLFPSTPTYDPWAWLIWGREIISGHLSTTTGPSWKPLPVLFTSVFALAGGAAPALWLVVARAGGLLAIVCTFRLARRLGGPAAGVVAAAALVLLNFFARAAFLGDSEGLLVAFVLLAVELHLMGRRRDALLSAFAAGLLRPEVWIFLGLYGAWLLWREPRYRLLVAGLALALPVLWFGPELWGSGDLLRASSRAQEAPPGSPGAAADPIAALWERGWPAIILPVRVGALIALVHGALTWRRRPASRVVVLLGLAAVVWFVEVGVMTAHGYSGNMRYLIAPSALVCVLGGAGFGRLLAMVPWGPGRALRLGVAAALAAVVVGYAIEPWEQLGRDATAVRTEARLADALPQAVRLGGGPAAVLACGKPTIGNLQVTPLVWQLHAHMKDVGYIAPPRAMVFLAKPAHRGAGLPRAQPKGGGYRALGVSGVWHVLARCGPGRS